MRGSRASRSLVSALFLLLCLLVIFTVANRAHGATALARTVSDPCSASHGKYLTPSPFRARTLAQAQSAFGPSFGIFEVRGLALRAPLAQLPVPSDVAASAQATVKGYTPHQMGNGFVDASADITDPLRTFDDYSGSTSQHTTAGGDNVTGVRTPNASFLDLIGR